MRSFEEDTKTALSNIRRTFLLWRSNRTRAPAARAPEPLRYRPEIDGLRGLAVLAVLLYHAHVPGFSGGYVGVDAFFVISGYLITQLLEGSLRSGKVRVAREFYLRRARRLVPALGLVLAVTAAVAAAVYLPADLVRFGRDLLLSTLFLGNVGAWLDGGYFDPGWRFTPLRHLWSIAVEEQFYLLFPFFLFSISALTLRSKALIVSGLALCSLLLAVWAAGHWPVQNYYLLPTRGWELLIGALLALLPRSDASRRPSDGLVAVLAVALLAYVVWGASFEDFPSFANVATCAGTAVLVRTNTGRLTGVGHALSLRPVVFTGLISYSLYLWHAPVLAFVEYYGVDEPAALYRAMILVAIYGVSVLSWWFVERPFRMRPLAESARLLACIGVPAAVVLAGWGYALEHSDGLPGRFAPEVLRLAKVEAPRLVDAACLNPSDEAIAAGHICAFGPRGNGVPRVVVWGDSHAHALLPAYRALADKYGLRIYFATKGACWPLVGAEAGRPGNYWHDRCVKFNQAMVRAIHSLRPQRVILNAYWRDTPTEALLASAAPPGTAAGRGIGNTLAAVRSAGASACAVLTVPGYPYPIPYARAMAEQRKLPPQTLGLRPDEARSQFEAVETELRSFAARRELTLVDLKEALCSQDRCRVAAEDGASLYQDANHLSVAGSRWVTPALQACVEDVRSAELPSPANAMH